MLVVLWVCELRRSTVVDVMESLVTDRCRQPTTPTTAHDDTVDSLTMWRLCGAAERNNKRESHSLVCGVWRTPHAIARNQPRQPWIWHTTFREHYIVGQRRHQLKKSKEITWDDTAPRQMRAHSFWVDRTHRTRIEQIYSYGPQRYPIFVYLRIPIERYEFINLLFHWLCGSLRFHDSVICLLVTFYRF